MLYIIETSIEPQTYLLSHPTHRTKVCPSIDMKVHDQGILGTPCGPLLERDSLGLATLAVRSNWLPAHCNLQLSLPSASMVHQEACLIDAIFHHIFELSLYRVFDRLRLRSCIAVRARGRRLVLPIGAVKISRDDGAALDVGLCLDLCGEVGGIPNYDGTGIKSG
jgi:hypothetical protein